MHASIDVGTNTVRGLVGEIRSGLLFPLERYQKITRLGGDMRGGFLDVSSMSRTLEALVELSSIFEKQGVTKVKAVGTAALRKAANSTDFLKQVKSSTGFEIEILAGDEEARLSAAGVLNGLSSVPERLIIFDIGGGSTEIVLLEHKEVLFQASYSLGVVSLVEEQKQ